MTTRTLRIADPIASLRVVVYGSATGQRYEYRPENNGLLRNIDESDVAGLLSMTRASGGCKCTPERGGVQQDKTTYNLFEEA